MKILILSDIHGNKSALQSVLSDAQGKYEKIILLGDIIDYGPHSNEVIEIVKELSVKIPVLCNIRGNHEQAIIEDNYTGFSSKRGVQCAKNTRNRLTKMSWKYITQEMAGSGVYEFMIDQKFCLAVHGSLEDIYWKAVECRQDLEKYKKYDYVFSGHSHIPYFFEIYYKIHDPIHRDKKKTIFINPGSVGQPRNHNSRAQYVIFNTETEAVSMLKTAYDIKKEQQAFSETVDVFYKERLETGV